MSMLFSSSFLGLLLIVISLLLLTSKFSSASSSSINFIDVFSTWKSQHCPSVIILYLDQEALSANEHLVDTLLSCGHEPTIIIETLDNIPANGTIDIHCNNLVLLASKLKDLSSIYAQIIKDYHHIVSRTLLLITNCCSVREGENVLNQIRDDQVSLLLSNGSFMHRAMNGNLLVGTMNMPFPPRNLRDVHLKLTTLHFPPAVFLEGGAVVGGIETAIMSVLADGLGFTYEYVTTAANEMWGTVLPDGNVTGIKGMLIRKEADVAFGDIYLSEKWMDYLSFSKAYKINYDCFILPAPRPYAKWKAIFFPLTPAIWLASLFSFILAIITLRVLLGRYSSFSEDSSQFSFIANCFLYVFGNVLWVQSPRSVRSDHGRFFLAFWFFAATIISSVYRSGLISFMSSPLTQPAIDTIQQLVQSPINKVMFTDYYKGALLNSTDPWHRLLGEQIAISNNLTEMYSLVLDRSDKENDGLDDEWAVDSSLDSILYLSAGKPGLHIMKECLFPTRCSLGFQKNSPLKEYFDHQLQRLIEAGFIEFHRRQVLNRIKIQEDSQQHQSDSSSYSPFKHSTLYLQPFSLKDLQGAFFLLLIGWTISFVFLIIEILFAYCLHPPLIQADAIFLHTDAQQDNLSLHQQE